MNQSKRRIPRNFELYGNFRVEAQAIWNGPVDVVNQIDGGNSFYGWRVLQVESRSGEHDILENRAVYGNLYDSNQHDCILRAVQWNGQKVIRSISKNGRSPSMILPARFVVIPAEHLRAWLADLDGLAEIIDTQLPTGNLEKIRRLRIDLDQKTSIMERVWQGENQKYALLNQKWENIWNSMTEMLRKGVAHSPYNEDFRFVQPEFVYDLEAYTE